MMVTMIDDDVSVLKTSDFTLASTLNCLGFDIMGIDKTNLNRVVFYFRRTSDLENALNSYWKHEVTVVPQEFELSRSDLKAKIHTDYD